jgi:hypothetical protein
MYCIDSDDWIGEDAVKKIISFWSLQSDKASFAGIVGLAFFKNGQIIGSRFPETRSVNLIERMTGLDAKKQGDRAIVVRTDLYKKVAPMQGFEGEKNFNPNYMNLEISREYDFLVMNECLMYKEYQETGMSGNMFKQYLNSPNSFAEIRKQYLSFEDTKLKFRIRHSIHYTSSCILARKGFYETIYGAGHPFLCTVCLPAGFLLSYYIRFRVRTNKGMKIPKEK